MIRTRFAQDSRNSSVAFLFLGELFLISHLLPIAAALARRPSPPDITLFVITSAHERIVRDWLVERGLGHLRIKRARGYRRLGGEEMRASVALPNKLLTLARNARAILAHDAVVVAERTSLWLPRVLRSAPPFVYNEHGAAPHGNFTTARNRSAARLLMPGPGMASRVNDCAPAGTRIETVGYIKRDYLRDRPAGDHMPVFPEARPTVVYMPHWLRGKSSWWAMGEQVLDYFARSNRYNLILAPHLRLPEADPAFEQRVARFRDCPNIHIDTGSFRLIDQTYVDGADIYLGDGSSQVVEFASKPRPVVFLNPDGVNWAEDPRFSHWQMGDVVSSVEGLDAALAASADRHRTYAPLQRAYVDRMMGPDDGLASERAADVVLALLAAPEPAALADLHPLAPYRDRKAAA